MTLYWRQLNAELQLEQGGALSMADILSRMKDSIQLELQNTERELCCCYNAIAMKLLDAHSQARRCFEETDSAQEAMDSKMVDDENDCQSMYHQISIVVSCPFENLRN